MFENSCTFVKDDYWKERSLRSTTHDKVQRIHKLLLINRRVTVVTIAPVLDISHKACTTSFLTVSDVEIFAQWMLRRGTHVIEELFEKCEWKYWEHPSYSPEIASCDVHVFDPYERGPSKPEISHSKSPYAVWECLLDVGWIYFSNGDGKLLSHYKKCLIQIRDFVKKIVVFFKCN